MQSSSERRTSGSTIPISALATEERARRRAAGENEPRRLVITRHGEGIEASQKMFDPSRGGPAYVVHSEDMPAATRARLGKVATLVAMGATAVDMAQMLTWMKRDLGVRTLLCEGGGVLTAQLFAARAVDQLYVTFVPRILGGEHAPTMVEGPGFAPDSIPDAKSARSSASGKSSSFVTTLCGTNERGAAYGNRPLPANRSTRACRAVSSLTAAAVSASRARRSASMTSMFVVAPAL